MGRRAGLFAGKRTDAKRSAQSAAPWGPGGRKAPPPSMILEDGNYEPGKDGMVALRRKNAEELFFKNPALGRAVWKDPAARRFHEEAALGFHDTVQDGFRARFSQEILLVDRAHDRDLQQFLAGLRARLDAQREGGLDSVVASVQTAAAAVCEAFGGSAASGCVEARWQEKCAKIGTPPPADTLLGKFIGGTIVGRPGEPGAGMCRHRAILLKYACDTFGIAECAVLTGVVVPSGGKNVMQLRAAQQVADHMWNVVRVYGRPYLVDCMFHPGKLLDAEALVKIEAGAPARPIPMSEKARKDLIFLAQGSLDDPRLRERILRAVPRFSPLGGMITQVAERMFFEKPRHGEVVVEQGEIDDTLRIVVNGGLVATKSTAEFGDRTVKDYQPGDVFGELALVGKGRQPAAHSVIVVTEDARLLCLGRNDLKMLSEPAQQLVHSVALGVCPGSGAARAAFNEQRRDDQNIGPGYGYHRIGGRAGMFSLDDEAQRRQDIDV